MAFSGQKASTKLGAIWKVPSVTSSTQSGSNYAGSFQGALVVHFSAFLCLRLQQSNDLDTPSDVSVFDGARRKVYDTVVDRKK